jgi:hypothetical protein
MADCTRDAVDNQQAEAQKALELLHGGSALIESRVFVGPKTLSAFTNNIGSLARAVPRLEGWGAQSYLVLNPVIPGRFAFSAFKKQKAAADQDIAFRRWMFFDFDPEREGKVCSTDAEKAAAHARALEVRQYLQGAGFSEMVLADSGNGYHLIVRIDLPNSGESISLVRRVLEGVAEKFPPEGEHPIKVDRSVSNASRLIKFYGTTARKGEDTRERPHRMSRILEAPEEITPASREVLESVASERRYVTPTPCDGPKDARLDLPSWLARYRVPIVGTDTRKMDNGEEVTVYQFEHCPLGAHDGDQAGVWQFASGAIVARCFHDTCLDFHTEVSPGRLNAWHAVREQFQGYGKTYGYIE